MNSESLKIKNLLTGFIIVLFSSCLIYGQGKTAVTSARVSGKGVINKDELTNISVSPEDSLTFYFTVDGQAPGQAELQYRVFLNGRLFEPDLSNSNDGFVTFSSLKTGEYVLKVQGFLPGKWDAEAAVLRFVVGKPNGKSPDNIAAKAELAGDSGGEGMNNTLIYILSALCILLAAVIVFLLLRKNKAQPPKAYDGDQLADLQYSYNKLKKELEALRSGTENHDEDRELRNAYERLKQEYANLKENNGFLRQQVSNLKNYITDLENANVQLAQQKEKLLESKRQLEELQRQKDELYAIAIHDIKNPAAAIRGYVELLESYDLNAQEQQEIMQSLANTSSRIIDLAQKMSMAVAQSQPESAVQMDNASIKQITDDICKRNMAYANKKKVKLINNTSPNTPVTRLDPFKIEEAVDNLVNNAIKYAPEGTVVQVRSYFSDKSIMLEVIDNGVGLSEEDCRHVFEKGALLAPKPTGGEARSGLGLWIVRKIIEEHGGRVYVKSKKGVGSTFGFELPVRGR